MTLKEHALEYAQAGIKVFPCHTPEAGKCSCHKDTCGSIGKHPRTAGGFLDATADFIQIANWWDMWPQANIGAVTDSLLVLDGDSIEAVEYASRNGLPNTWTVKRGDHRHFFYKQPSPALPRMTGKNAIFPKLDILGSGGYVILPPSKHASGENYEALNKFDLDIINDCPLWVIDQVTQKQAEVNYGKARIDGNEPLESGMRNEALASMAGTLWNLCANEKIVTDTLLAYNLTRCKPPLSEQEVVTIAHSICRYQTSDSVAFNATIFTHDPEEKPLQRDGLLLPLITHGTASDCLFDIVGGKIVHDTGNFFQKKQNYWEPAEALHDKARRYLERAAKRELSAYAKRKDLTEKERALINSNYGKAIQRIRTNDFLRGALDMLSEKIHVPQIKWNISPGCLPCLDKIIDFSGDYPIARDALDGEFFRNPAPCKAQEIIDAPSAFKFEKFMENLFYDPDTRETALQCLSLCISGVPSKTAQIWHNSGGDGGKNSLFDLLSFLIPSRIVMIKSSVITTKGDASERRFGEAECEGRGGIFFDELSAEIDINQIKKLTGLSEITAERKGKNPFTFRQTWALAMLCNRLPRFRPAEDSAFISRLLVLPFSSVFYVNEDIKALKIKTGVDENNLRPAQDKQKMIEGLLAERPGIIRALIAAWIRCRDNYGGIPYKSRECKEAAERYRIENDDVEKFFDECFERTDHAHHVTYDDIKTAWMEFSGKSHFDGMRWLIKELVGKFNFLETGATNGVRIIKGMEKLIIEVKEHDEGNF